MIPASYLFRDLYAERWGDPHNPHAVEVADPAAPVRRFAPLSWLTARFRRRTASAWSFTIPTAAVQDDCRAC